MIKKYNKIEVLKCFSIIYIIIILYISCTSNETLNIKNQIILNEEILTSVLNSNSLYKSRSHLVYAESFIALNEIYQMSTSKYNSINNQIKGFIKILPPTENIDYEFSSLAAFYIVLDLNKIKNEKIEIKKINIFNFYKKILNSKKYENSLRFSTKVANTVFKNFEKNKNFLIINDIDELGYNHPKNFKNKPKSELINNSKDLIKINDNLSDLQKIICNYWEGNNEKQINKINIEGHWFGILSQEIKKSNIPTFEITKAYAMLGLNINEAYKIGNYEEYKYTYSSPYFIIINNINKKWTPYLRSKIIEYNSINSIVSLSASIIISSYLNDNSPFIDSSIFKYTGYIRKYNSLDEAASEASISRAYGGIHYIFTVNEAASQGRALASKMLERIK